MKNKKQIIYTRLLEGTTCYVPCEAIGIDENIFEIIKNNNIDLDNDVSQIWEFFPGDTVRCITKTETVVNFDEGILIPVDSKESKNSEEKKILLASGLINSVFPNRRVYELIFKIVYSLGAITFDELQDYKNEIEIICFDTKFIQRNHPVVKMWLEVNCSLSRVNRSLNRSEERRVGKECRL